MVEKRLPFEKGSIPLRFGLQTHAVFDRPETDPFLTSAETLVIRLINSGAVESRVCLNVLKNIPLQSGSVHISDPEKRPRRKLGRLAGKGRLTREQAFAPMSEEELKEWEGN